MPSAPASYVRLLALIGLLAAGCLGRLSTADRAWHERLLQTRASVRIDPVAEGGGPAIAGTDPRIAFIGRRSAATDGSPGSLPLFWAGSEVRVRFVGPGVTLRLRSDGEVHFTLWVDDHAQLLSIAGTGEHRYATAPVAPGRHLLRLIKRTEAAAGHAELVALHPQPGTEILDAPTLPTRRLEFLGDSMTVGACAYDDGPEHWDRRETHDHSASFAARTAQALQAQHQAIAVSGLGVTMSRVDLRAEQIFDRQRPSPQSAEADKDLPPDAVVVLLGHNDVLAARRAGQRFPATFTNDYVRLIRGIRARYPHSLIVCATGGMFGSRHSCALRRAWNTALRRLQSDDARILGHVFAHTSFFHPRADAHAKLATELAPLLARHLGWARPSAHALSTHK